MARRDALLRLASRLIARRDALRTTLDGDLASFRSVSEVSGVGDHGDAAVDSANDEVCTQLVEIESRELGQIEHALDRIRVGVYGRCESCGDRIPAARLNALPYTNSCINCQREKERRGQSGAQDADSERWAEVGEEPIEERQSDVAINLGEFGMNSRECGRWPIESLLV
jgi:DnaK suppressor protein